MSVGLARVTVSAPRRRIDVALPEHVPLVELLPEVLRHAGEGLADDGEQHGGWLLRRADGAALGNSQGLYVQGVRDGEVLHLVPARAEWPELEYDDVVEAIADGARRRGTAWSSRATRTATLTAAGVPFAVGLLAVFRHGPVWSGAGFAALGAAVALTVAAVAAARAYADARAAATFGGFALPYGFAAGAALVSSGDRVGVLPPVAWVGAEELLAGSVVLLLFAVLGAVGVAASVRVFAAGATVGLLGGLIAGVALSVSAAGSAAILLAALVCAVGALPLLAIRFGKLPVPPISPPSRPDASGDGTAAAAPGSERPERDRVFAAVARTEELLTGMLIGHAVLAVAASVVLVVAGGLWGRIMVGAAAASLLLRSRLFVTVRQRVPLIAAGLAGLAALGLAGSAGRPGWSPFVVLTAVLVTAVVTVAAGATFAHRPPSPYLGRAADLLDTLIVVSVVPLACAVLGLYGRMRGLVG